MREQYFAILLSWSLTPVFVHFWWQFSLKLFAVIKRMRNFSFFSSGMNDELILYSWWEEVYCCSHVFSDKSFLLLSRHKSHVVSGKCSPFHNFSHHDLWREKLALRKLSCHLHCDSIENEFKLFKWKCLLSGLTNFSWIKTYVVYLHS